MLKIFEFHRTPGRLVLESRAYEMELQGRLDRNPRWVRLHCFSVNVDQKSLPHINQALLAFDNELAE